MTGCDARECHAWPGTPNLKKKKKTWTLEKNEPTAGFSLGPIRHLIFRGKSISIFHERYLWFPLVTENERGWTGRGISRKYRLCNFLTWLQTYLFQAEEWEEKCNLLCNLKWIQSVCVCVCVCVCVRERERERERERDIHYTVLSTLQWIWNFSNKVFKII